MAELEITYIPYGLDEISQLDLMTNLANGLPDFVKSYKWLLKPGITEKFLNAYKDIINHGITGASDSSGLWEITHNGDKIDTDNMSPLDKLIYEHAAYYIQLKMALMTPRKKEEETAKKDLKDFNFINDFNTNILNEYGGLQALFLDPETGWNSLDPRGDNGLRGIDKRRDKVRGILQNYLDNYKDGQYNFEGTSFKDDADVRTKVLNAINALDTIDNTTDDVEAFNALGLPYKTYFSNGGNEPTDKINPQTGTPYTYNEWNLLQEAKTKAESEAKLNEIKRKIQHYRERSKYFDLLLNLLNSSNTNKLSENKEQTNVSRLLSNGMQYLDYARIGAALGDVISLGGFWANVGGSIVSLLGDTTADIADDKVSTWEAVKNFGKNLGWTAAGFIPGGKLGKVAEHMLRWGPKLMVALNDYNLLNDESNKNTWNKLTSDKLVKEGLNDEDLKNITYWVRALTGTANAAKATARDIKYSKARGERKQEFTTKDNSKVTLSKDQVKEINKVGATKGQLAAKDLFKSKTGKDVSDNEFSFTESGRRGPFKGFRSKLGDERLLGKTVVERNPTQQRYYDLYSLDRDKGGWFGWRPIWSRGTSSYFDHFDSGGFKNPFNGVTKKLDPYREIVSPKTESKKWSEIEKGPSKWNRSAEAKEYEDMLRGKFGTNVILGGVHKIGDLTIDVDIPRPGATNGFAEVSFKDGSKLTIRFDTLKQLLEQVAKIIKERRILTDSSGKKIKVDVKEMSKILKSLKSKGFLKLGGKVNPSLDEVIKDFINNNNI